MEVYVELDALGVAKVIDECYHAPILRGVGGLFALICLSAGVCRRAERVCVPHERPLAVDVTADTGLVCGGWGRLTILPPEAVIGLGIDEAWATLDGWAER